MRKTWFQKPKPWMDEAVKRWWVGLSLWVSGVPSMGEFQAKPVWAKLLILGAFVVVPVLLPFAGPWLGIEEGGRISLNYLQSFYALVSIELAVAVYLWGVGKWSRFEPPATTDKVAGGQ